MGAQRLIGRAGLLAEVTPEGALLTSPRSNLGVTVFPPAARTATSPSADITNPFGKAAHVCIRVTAAAGAPSVVFTVQGRDEVSGEYYPVLASAAITGVGTTILRIAPGLTAAANLTANDVLPRTWRVLATHANGDSISYSCGASILL